MADETKVEAQAEVVKDPTQKSFWRPRNIGLLLMTAILPALTGWAWNRCSEALTHYFARQNAQDARIKAIEDDTRQRLKDLEDDRANNKAIWDAITEGRNRDTEQDIEIRVLKKLFDREFGKQDYKLPTAKPEKPVQDQPVNPPVPLKPEQLRLEKEAQHPIQKK
jgi:hypothetical protein